MNLPFGGEGKMVPFEPVVLTDGERQECQTMLHTLTQVEGGYYAIREELADSFKRSIVALCMMGRAERFLIAAGGGLLTGAPPTPGQRYRAEYGERACQAAAKACGVFPLSIYFYDFACVLRQVGRPEEANQMLGEFLRRLETEVLDPIMRSTLKRRDVDLAAQFARQWYLGI